MRCPDCNNEASRFPKVPFCEVCGRDLRPAHRATTADVAPPPAAAPSPHAVRRTVYEPAGAAPVPSAGAGDFFAHPPPPRPPLNPKDPFASSQAGAPAASVSVPAVAGQRTGTQIDVGAAQVGPLLRGALLEFRGPGDAGKLHGLRMGRNTLGRDASCDIALQDGRVSSLHGYIFIKEGEAATFMDASTNGSRVDGAALHGSVVPLKHGSTLELGDSQLVCLLLDWPAAGRGAKGP